MNIERVIVGTEKVNCYFLWDSKKNCIVIDPGNNSDILINFIEKNEFNLKGIILTHYHYDHILAVEDLNKRYNSPIYIHENGLKGLENPEINLSLSRPVKTTKIKAHKGLKDGDKLSIGELNLDIIYTPGHTLSDICIKYENVIFTGDTLFKGSIGRSDFKESSYDSLKNSILNKLLVFDDEVIIYPGHYEKSTIGEEREYNPKIKMFATEFNK